MLLDVEVIEAKKTISDYYGVYHSYQAEEEIRTFLMFCCSTRADAVRFGAAVAEVLGVPFRNKLSDPTPGERADEDRREAEGNIPATNPSKFATYTTRHGTVMPVASASTNSGVGGNRKKVMGVGAQVRELLAKGLIDSDIVEQCIPLYTAAGKTETVARNLLKPYVAEIRKLEAKKGVRSH